MTATLGTVMGMEGYAVDIDAVLQLAKTNYDIAERYAEVTSKFTRTDDANGHLTDKDGAATAADSDVIAMLDEFFEYLKTTTARYYLAGEQLEAAAKAYVEQEDASQADIIDSYKGMGDYDLDWDPEKVADDTDRPEGANTDQADGFGTQENPVEEDDQGEDALEELDDEKGGN